MPNMGGIIAEFGPIPESMAAAGQRHSLTVWTSEGYDTIDHVRVHLDGMPNDDSPKECDARQPPDIPPSHPKQ